MKKAIVSLLISAVILIGVIVSLEHVLSKTDRTLKVAFPSRQMVSHYEPGNIQFVFEYIFLENTFSTLVEMDTMGKIIPGLAERFFWKGSDLHLTIRSNVTTQSGTPITANDVVFSLKRLLVLGKRFKNTHGNFNDLVCPNVNLESVDQECTGIRSVGNEVILNAGSRKPFLLPMLAAIDFAIIPKGSVDASTLEIKNYKETSGLYYVNQDLGNGNIELKMNPHHFHSAEDLAQTVQLVPFDIKNPNGAIELFDQGKVDHLMVSNGAKIENLIRYFENRDDVQIHATMKIKKFMLVFTERGQKDLSLAQRRWVGKQIRDVMVNLYQNQRGYEPTDEFFMEAGDGALTRDERNRLAQIPVTDVDVPKIRIGLIRNSDVDFWGNPIREKIPNAIVYQEHNVPDLHIYDKTEEMPHAFIAGTDTGFMEDINLISYSLNTGFLGLTKPEREHWLATYMSIDDSALRKEALRKLHFQALENAISVPLVACPFVAVIRKPWRMELSQVFSNNQLWHIKHQ
jgi:hypothetical protein